MPGNPALAMMGKFRGPVNPAALKALEVAFGVDTKQSLISQYFGYLGDIATGKFGTSLYFYPESVGHVVLDAIPWTLGLVGVTTILAFVLGTGIGIVAAWRRGGIAGQHPAAGLRDHLGGPLLLDRPDADPDLLRRSCSWFPSSFGYDVTLTPSLTGSFIGNVLWHAVLPAAALLITTIGTWILTMRNTMVTTLAEDYVRMARAKGLPGRRIMFDYAARNAILPNLTGFAMSLGFVVGGAILVEYVFNYPGVGYMLLQAVQQRGLPADAGAVPAHHRGGAGGHPDR